MVRHYVSRDEMMLEKIFQDLRGGKSLFSACEKVNISTKDFYAIIEKKSVFREKFLCSLSDYADRCVDDIRDIVGQLKAGEIDNSTAKLLIETMKWMLIRCKVILEKWEKVKRLVMRME